MPPKITRRNQTTSVKIGAPLSHVLSTENLPTAVDRLVYDPEDKRLIGNELDYCHGKFYSVETTAEATRRRLNPLELEELQDEVDQVLARLYLKEQFGGE